LHERPAASQEAGDGGSLVTFEGPQNRSIPVPLLAVLLLTPSLTQVFEILGMVPGIRIWPYLLFVRICIST
jgi:hypothetical protein